MTRGTLPNVICSQLSGFAPPPKHAWFLRKNKSPSSLRTRACFVAWSHVFGCCANRTYPPAPFLRGKGSKALLVASISGCSDGIDRGHKAIKNPSHLPRGTYPPAPFLRGKGSKAPLMASIYGYSDGIDRGHKAIKKPSSIPSQRTYPSAPFLRGKGSKAPLMASIKGCFDGVGRMDHAMNPENLSHHLLAKPIRVPPSS